MPTKGELHLCENTTSTQVRLKINFAFPFLGKIFLIYDSTFFFNLGFLSRKFTNYRIAGERDYLF